jgi:hypothetical protein
VPLEAKAAALPNTKRRDAKIAEERRYKRLLQRKIQKSWQDALRISGQADATKTGRAT